MLRLKRALCLALCLAVIVALSAGYTKPAETCETQAHAENPADAARREIPAEEKLDKEPQAEDLDAVFEPLDVPLEPGAQMEIYAMCLRAGVPFGVILGLIEHESGFDPNAVSPTDDHGVTQINRCNFGWLQEELGPIDFYDTVQNVRACLRILGPLWEKHGPHKALMAYQYGPTGAARKWASGQVTSCHSKAVLEKAAGYGWTA